METDTGSTEEVGAGSPFSPAPALPAKLSGVTALRFARFLLVCLGLPVQLVAQALEPGASVPSSAGVLAEPLRATAVARAMDDPPAAIGLTEAKRFGAVLVLGGLAYLADESAREWLHDASPGSGGLANNAFAFADRYGDPGVAVLAAALWGTGLIAKRPVLAEVGLRGVEAVGVSGLATVLLKEIAGRARPRVAPHDRADWQLLRPTRTGSEDHRSMPSGHATVAFAFATAVTGTVQRRAPQHATWVGVSSFGLAGLTAWQRMRADAHWLSDVTVGAGIGTVTALAILRWHDTRPGNSIDRWLLRPALRQMGDGTTAVGLSLTWP